MLGEVAFNEVLNQWEVIKFLEVMPRSLSLSVTLQDAENGKEIKFLAVMPRSSSLSVTFQDAEFSEEKEFLEVALRASPRNSA